MTEARQIARVRDYMGLIAALRARADELELTRDGLDEAMQTLPDRYASKLLASPPIRNFGRISLGPMLDALGLEIVLVENLKAVERISKQIAKRRQKSLDAGHRMLATTKRRRWKFPKGADHASLMRARQILTQPAEKRSAIARRAARIRWRRHRQARKPKKQRQPSAPGAVVPA
jgi:hypothetical protein